MTHHDHALLRYVFTGLGAGTIGGEVGLNMADVEQMHSNHDEARDVLFERHRLGELGFMSLGDVSVESIVSWAKEVRASAAFDDHVVLGIGGSSLGALAILQTAPELEDGDGLRTHFSESVDPHSFSRLLSRLDLSRTLVTVITKSGSTIETMSKFWILYEQMIEELGQEETSRRIIAITDPDPQVSALRRMADAHGFRTFDVPSNVGGRFSVLTPVGLVPLALAGYDLEGLLSGARRLRDHFRQEPPVTNAPLAAASHHIALLDRGITQTVMIAYCDRLEGMVDWFRQLWGESLGKRHDLDGKDVFVGLTPIKAMGVIDQHSQVQLWAEGPVDKHIVFVDVEDHGTDVEVPEREGLPDKIAHLSGKIARSDQLGRA